MERFFELKNLNYLDLFQNLSISFPKQKFISLSGPNNCGKTTLIRILNGEISSNNSLLFKDKIIEEDNIDDYFKSVKSIIPEELNFLYETLNEEILSSLTKANKEEYNYLLKSLHLSKLKNISFNCLSIKELIKIKLLLILINCPKVILLDDIARFFSKEEFIDIITCLKKYQDIKKLTIIMTTSNLNETLFTDYLYIIYNGKVFLEGKPLDILIKDNVLNKIGLQLPFMVDLSVKLQDYNLIEEIELDMNRMVDKLWK